MDLVDDELARGERARLMLLVQSLDDRRVDARVAADRSDEAAALVEALLAERRAISACDAWCPTPLVTRAGSSVLPW